MPRGHVAQVEMRGNRERARRRPIDAAVRPEFREQRPVERPVAARGAMWPKTPSCASPPSASSSRASAGLNDSSAKRERPAWRNAVSVSSSASSGIERRRNRIACRCIMPMAARLLLDRSGSWCSKERPVLTSHNRARPCGAGNRRAVIRARSGGVLISHRASHHPGSGRPRSLAQPCMQAVGGGGGSGSTRRFRLSSRCAQPYARRPFQCAR